MLHKIERQIENINGSIEWIRKYKSEIFEQRFISLVEERLKLRILAAAESNNPSIAAFGQSQVGKSYLMNCILQNGGAPFEVEAGDKSYNFVEEINPIGEGQEATGVVTRFSSYSRNANDYDRRFPIRMKVLGVRDIINIIGDIYFNEFDDYKGGEEERLREFCAGLKSKYMGVARQVNPILEADDMLFIKSYFKKHINNAQVFSRNFFDPLALLIDKIPLTDYVDIFSKLWNDEPEYIKLFNRYLDVLKRLHFEEYIYLPIESVLHKGKKEDTLMSVSCLKLLLTENEPKYKTLAYSKKVNSDMTSLGEFTKSELCMACSEVVIKIGDKYLSTTGQYDFSGISPTSQSKLSKEPIKLEILKTTDLLDFPGARARGNMRLDQIKSHDNLMYTFLRGKVAYLFNKYNEEKNLNILLFCHHHKNVESPQMWQLLDEWVSEYVGSNPEKREEYIRRVGISPLFHVGTMFNLNLQEPDNATQGKSDEGIMSRWMGRFKEKLIEECFKKADWVTNWDGKGKPFQNCYMLRDFKFSTNIYEGWSEKGGKETKLRKEVGEDYFQRMKELFIESNREHHLFSDPELAWDVAATPNNDGALYILCKLDKISAVIADAREKQIEEQLNDAIDSVYSIMKEHYQNTDIAELLDENISKAWAIMRELEFTCPKDNYYFGHLIQALQMTGKESYTIVHDIMQSPELNERANTTEYENILKRCRESGHPIEQCEREDDKWSCLVDTYRFRSRKEAEEFLSRMSVDVEKLFSGKFRKKLNSYIISEEVLNSWMKNIKSLDFFNGLCSDEGLSATIMSNLVENYTNIVSSMGLLDIMSDAIKTYVNVTDVHAANEEMLADVLATIINNFVLDFGYRYLSSDVKGRAKSTYTGKNEREFKYIDTTIPSIVDKDGLTAMFNSLSENNDEILLSFDENYNKWLDNMFISFVANQDIPNFDREANDALKGLLDDIKPE